MSYGDIDEYGNVEWPMPDNPSSPSEARSAEAYLPILDMGLLLQAVDELRRRKPEDDFRAPVSAPRKCRRALEDELEAPQQCRVHVTEQLRARNDGPAVQTLARWAFDNALEHMFSPWIRREVCGRLYRGWVHVCTQLVCASSYSVQEDEDSPPEKDDHVYPEYPNLEGYREPMPGDAQRGAFGCEYCPQTFGVARALRLHTVDEHLYMTGGAGPAASMESGDDEDVESAESVESGLGVVRRVGG